MRQGVGLGLRVCSWLDGSDTPFVEHPSVTLARPTCREADGWIAYPIEKIIDFAGAICRWFLTQ